MAEVEQNDDSWLYGESNTESEKKADTNSDTPPKGKDTKDVSESEEKMETGTGVGERGADLEEGQLSAEEGENEPAPPGDDDEDTDDDDVMVVIGDIKAPNTSSYTSFDIKRRPMATPGISDKTKQGKFSIEDFEMIGTINGVPAHEFNLDSLEEKPWRKPGADITDYFNYGFNEDTWRAYCERQKRMRISESGVGIAAIGGTNKSYTPYQGTIPVSIINDNSKYSGMGGPKKAGPPPGRKMTGTIDVIGGNVTSRRSLEKATPPKENAIQVMTADKREYSKKVIPDMSVPPPNMGAASVMTPPTVISTGTYPTPGMFDVPPPGMPPPNMGGFPTDPYGQEFYDPGNDPYYQSYEPTQESQWTAQVWSNNSNNLEVNQQIVTSVSEASNQDSQDAPVSGQTSKERSEEKSSNNERSKHRRRSRSRSHERSRRRQSRSRSPSHRHKRKKSKREREEKDGKESE